MNSSRVLCHQSTKVCPTKMSRAPASGCCNVLWNLTTTMIPTQTKIFTTAQIWLSIAVSRLRKFKVPKGGSICKHKKQSFIFLKNRKIATSCKVKFIFFNVFEWRFVCSVFVRFLNHQPKKEFFQNCCLVALLKINHMIPDGPNYRSVAAPISKLRPDDQPSSTMLSVCSQCGRLIT